MLKGFFSNVVEATSKEEQIHGDFGIDLIKIHQKENLNGLPQTTTEIYTSYANKLMKQKKNS